MTLKEREDLFWEEIDKHDYDPKMKLEFYHYWSEPNKKLKMKWELEKTWCTKRRLQRWFDNNKKWSNGKTIIGGVTGKLLTEANKGDFGRL